MMVNGSLSHFLTGSSKSPKLLTSISIRCGLKGTLVFLHQLQDLGELHI